MHSDYLRFRVHSVRGMYTDIVFFLLGFECQC